MRGHNKSNTAEKKGGSKQECVNLEAFNGDLSIGAVVVCNVMESECGRRDTI
jgi:hypothetical protein